MTLAKSTPRTLTVPPEAAGWRLDRYLTTVLQPMSRAQLQQWIRDGHITVNHEARKPNYPIRSGDVIKVVPPPVVPSTVAAEAIPLDVIYEDDDLIVVNKAPGMVVHPGAGQQGGTLVNALLARAHGLSGIGGVERPGIVHRLDKGTSGLIIVAKHDVAHHHLSKQFSERTAEKCYLALCYGNLAERGTIDLPIGRHPTDRKRMSTESRHGRSALSHWRVREHFGALLSWIEVEIKTGRTHQIRVHLSAKGHPLVGDPVYGGKKMMNRLPTAWQTALAELHRPALHAWRLRVTHPTSGHRCEWSAPLPEDLADVLTACRRLAESS